MDIAIIGYGNMGREIEKMAREKGLHVAATVDPINPEAMFKYIDEQSMKGVDVAIDFTHPSAVIGNVKKLAALGIDTVVGTTGWYDRLDEARSIVEEAGTGLIWSGNFSLGVNIFFRIAENAAKIIDKFDDYDVYLHEFHHNKKADSPSGTAKMIADILLRNIERKDTVVTERLDRQIQKNELHVSSTRCGCIPGTHVIGFDSSADTIELRHTARTRSGFSLGAVLAAQWVKGRKGFFCIDDMMREVI